VASVVLGCGPVEYLGQVRHKAARAVAEAKQAGAERSAPYEYTSAVQYLNKAREEAGQAEYQIAVEYGRRSEDFAHRARAIAEQAAHRTPRRAPAAGGKSRDDAGDDAPAGDPKDSS
jgi:hypothetical protein